MGRVEHDPLVVETNTDGDQKREQCDV